MVIILEGANKTGKTTFAKMLQAAGFTYVKSNRIVQSELSNARMYGMFDVLVDLEKQGMNVVVDRFHITDSVYGSLERQYVDIKQIDEECAKAGFVLLYFTSSIEKMLSRGYENKTKVDIKMLIELYEENFKASKMSKYKISFEGESHASE